MALLGARQVGKTTLAKTVAKDMASIYLDLESPKDLAKLTDPTAFLESHSDKIIILDEIQRAPGRKSKKSFTASLNKQWNMLEGFVDERGQFTWDNPKANRNQKKQKQELKKVFQKFFDIDDSDPFEDYKDHKNRVCYRSKFHISSDE